MNEQVRDREEKKKSNLNFSVLFSTCSYLGCLKHHTGNPQAQSRLAASLWYSVSIF